MSNENFCVIVDAGKVTNVIVVEPNSPILAKNPTWIFVGENPQGIAIGWNYDGVNFTAPPPVLVPPEPRVITKVAFRFRLTGAEYVGIMSAAKTDIEVAAWLETFNMSTTIDLDNQRTIDGVQNLVGKNLLTQVRADEILNAPVQPGER